MSTGSMRSMRSIFFLFMMIVTMEAKVSNAYLVLPHPRHSSPISPISPISSMSSMSSMSLGSMPELRITKYSPLLEENGRKRTTPSFPSSLECVGLDVGCGCGRSTRQRAKDYPGIPWIGVDKMLDRFDRDESHLSFFSLTEKEKTVMFWHENFLNLPGQTSFQQMIQEKHVYLSFSNVLHEFWQDEEQRDAWFEALNEIYTYASSCTILIEDHYAQYPPSVVSFFFQSSLFQHAITQETKNSIDSSFSSFRCELYR